LTPAHAVISRVRRDLTLSTVLKICLGLAAAVAIWSPAALGNIANHSVLLLGVGVVWLVLSYRSLKGSRLAADAPSLIAAGRYEAAERHIDQALRSFSLFRTTKLLGIHHLATLRHAQRRWNESALLCRALIRQRLGPLAPLARASRLTLADSLLEMGDPAGAHEAVVPLYQERLTLGEALQLLSVNLDYQARVGDWRQMATRIETKTQMAELMPAAQAARAQALLALAAKRIGRDDWASWLRRRVELLADVQELCVRRPMLWDLWRVEDQAAPDAAARGQEQVKREDVKHEATPSDGDAPP
jgi:hypothetical protein